MIKIITAFIILITFSPACPQGTPVISGSEGAASDSVCISSLVSAEIDSALKQEKCGMMNYSYKNNSEEPDVKEVKKPEIVAPPQTADKPSFIRNTVFIKFSILAAASLAAALIVVLRRRKDSRKKPFADLLKENIGKMRTEDYVHKPNPVINDIRINLLQSDHVTIDSISSRARELKISKGELMLAARIKSYQLAQIGQNKLKV